MKGMKKRPGWKTKERLYNQITKDLQNAAGAEHTPPQRPLTSEEIEAMWWLSTRTKNQLKRDLVAEDHRRKVKAALLHGKE